MRMRIISEVFNNSDSIYKLVLCLPTSQKLCSFTNIWKQDISEQVSFTVLQQCLGTEEPLSVLIVVRGISVREFTQERVVSSFKSVMFCNMSSDVPCLEPWKRSREK